MKTLPREWIVHYWRTKGGAEVDFVLVLGERRIPIEVKAGRIPRLGRSARSFIDVYEPADLLLVTGVEDTDAAPEQVGPTRVHRVGLTALAGRLRALAAF